MENLIKYKIGTKGYFISRHNSEKIDCVITSNPYKSYGVDFVNITYGMEKLTFTNPFPLKRFIPYNSEKEFARRKIIA